jgi:hypothetical protein
MMHHPVAEVRHRHDPPLGLENIEAVIRPRAVRSAAEFMRERHDFRPAGALSLAAAMPLSKAKKGSGGSKG